MNKKYLMFLLIMALFILLPGLAQNPAPKPTATPTVEEKIIYCNLPLKQIPETIFPMGKLDVDITAYGDYGFIGVEASGIGTIEREENKIIITAILKRAKALFLSSNVESKSQLIISQEPSHVKWEKIYPQFTIIDSDGKETTKFNADISLEGDKVILKSLTDNKRVEIFKNEKGQIVFKTYNIDILVNQTSKISSTRMFFTPKTNQP